MRLIPFAACLVAAALAASSGPSRAAGEPLYSVKLRNAPMTVLAYPLRDGSYRTCTGRVIPRALVAGATKTSRRCGPVVICRDHRGGTTVERPCPATPRPTVRPTPIATPSPTPVATPFATPSPLATPSPFVMPSPLASGMPSPGGTPSAAPTPLGAPSPSPSP